MKSPQLGQDSIRLRAPHAHHGISTSLPRGRYFSIWMHRQAQDVIAVKREEVLHVFVPVVHHPARRRRVHDFPIRVVRPVPSRVVSSIPIRKIEL